MISTVKVTTLYECSLERAFKTPILCDVIKVHADPWRMPNITHTTHDENWGKPGSNKKVYVTKSVSSKGGFAGIDHVLERVENQYWKIQVDNFQSWNLGFYKFVGVWKTTEISHHKIVVEYTYYLHSNMPLLYPFNWIFAKTFWKAHMKRVLENVRTMAYQNEPYLYE